MKPYFILSILISLLTGCVKTENKNKAEPKETYRFKTGFEATFRFSGSFIESQNGTEYIYFADPETTKCLKIFTLNGQLVDSISLKDAMIFIAQLGGLSVKSRDTIILNSCYTNLLAIVNHKGEFVKKIEMDSLTKNPKGDHLELYSTWLAQKLYGNSVFFYTEWRYNLYEKDITDRLKDGLIFQKQNYATPYFCKIQDYCTDSPKVSFGLTNYFENFSKETDYFNDIPRYTCVNNKLFMHNIYSNKLYIIDPLTFNLQKKIPITSQYSSIAASPSPINQETIIKHQEISDSIYATTGAFLGFFYDQPKARYYLTLYHAVPSYLEGQIGFKKLPYSFISMDTTFTDFKEYKMAADTFFGGFSIMTKKGLLINTPGKNMKEDNTYTTFTRFEFN